MELHRASRPSISPLVLFFFALNETDDQCRAMIIPLRKLRCIPVYLSETLYQLRKVSAF